MNNESVQMCFKEIQRKPDWPKMLSETKYARTEKNTVMYFLVRSWKYFARTSFIKK